MHREPGRVCAAVRPTPLRGAARDDLIDRAAHLLPALRMERTESERFLLSSGVTVEDVHFFAESVWLGPSMCAKLADDAPPHWRNAQVRELLAAGRHPHVSLLRFEALTRSRWDFHSSTKKTGGAWKSDCTHWCYSQCFWDLHFHDMFKALQSMHVQQQQKPQTLQ